MDSGFPRIVGRKESVLSPWVTVVEKQVKFEAEAKAEAYHSLLLWDYTAIFAMTPEGKIPIVRQYRPAAEGYTWELPAGLVDPGENPRDTAIRELQEETGLVAQSVVDLGCCYSDTGRLENRIYSYFVKTSAPDPQFSPEPGMEVKFVSWEELKQLIREQKFSHQLHLGVCFAFELHRKDKLD